MGECSRKYFTKRTEMLYYEYNNKIFFAIMEGEREMKHTLHKRGLWLLTLLATLVFALGMTAQAAGVQISRAFRDRDDEAGDIYEQQ